MRIISFNINGIRAMKSKLKNGEKKGNSANNCIRSLISEECPDILCLQEIKTQSDADLAWLSDDFEHILTNVSSEKKGYSGVAICSNEEPEWVERGFKLFSEEEIGAYESCSWNDEGRVITAKFERFIVVCAYVPNSQAELARLHERIAFEGIMREYLKKLKTYECPVIYAGDLNIAPTAKDIHNPIGNAKSAGFSIQEREQFQLLLDCGFIDSFRHLYPDHVAYSYFSNMRNSRLNNKGWRIDLILVSKGYEDQIKGADVLGDYHGSDHCPVLLDIDV